MFCYRVKRYVMGHDTGRMYASGLLYCSSKDNASKNITVV